MSERGVLFDKVAFIGFGLIGSSLARAMRRGGLAAEIAVGARTERTLSRARELGLADRASLDPRQVSVDADLVIICTPVGACGAVAEAIGPVLKPGAIVTDVGSVKAAIIAAIAPHMPDHAHLVPGHPVAGTEHSGPDAGFAALFEGRWTILTPLPGGDADAVERVATLWRAVGGTVEIMDPDIHDKILAITSHLPHLIAYSIVGTADDLESSIRTEVIKFAAGGFRDFTRIAASDPVMWRDIFLHNRDSVLEILGRFSEDLIALQRAIRWGEGEKLEELFTRTREIRRGVIEARQA